MKNLTNIRKYVKIELAECGWYANLGIIVTIKFGM